MSNGDPSHEFYPPATPQTPNPFTGEGYSSVINPGTPQGREWLANYLQTMAGHATPEQVASALRNPLGKIALSALDPEARMHIEQYAGQTGTSGASSESEEPLTPNDLLAAAESLSSEQTRKLLQSPAGQKAMKRLTPEEQTYLKELTGMK